MSSCVKSASQMILYNWPEVELNRVPFPDGQTAGIAVDVVELVVEEADATSVVVVGRRLKTND
jgi:hypothetical protein